MDFKVRRRLLVNPRGDKLSPQLQTRALPDPPSPLLGVTPGVQNSGTKENDSENKKDIEEDEDKLRAAQAPSIPQPSRPRRQARHTRELAEMASCKSAKMSTHPTTSCLCTRGSDHWTTEIPTLPRTNGAAGAAIYLRRTRLDPKGRSSCCSHLHTEISGGRAVQIETCMYERLNTNENTNT